MVKRIGKKKLIKILKGEWPKKTPTEYQDLADCIRSDQVPASDIAKFFQDRKFYNWYKKKYLTY